MTDDIDHAPVEGFLVPLRGGVQLSLPKLGPAAFDHLEKMYASFGARADAGANLIVDDVLWHPRALAMATTHFADRDAWFVGVYCPTDVAVEREKRRGIGPPAGLRSSRRRFTAMGSTTSQSTRPYRVRRRRLIR